LREAGCRMTTGQRLASDVQQSGRLAGGRTIIKVNRPEALQGWQRLLFLCEVHLRAIQVSSRWHCQAEGGSMRTSGV
jgi:hypothetical protein